MGQIHRPDRLGPQLLVANAAEGPSGAITTHIIHHDPAAESWAAPTHLVIMGILALANWPADWRHLLRAPTPQTARTPHPTK
ncbi:hypothetical protein GCM10018965_006780 [Nonomuraea roseola]